MPARGLFPQHTGFYTGLAPPGTPNNLQKDPFFIRRPYRLYSGDAICRSCFGPVITPHNSRIHYVFNLFFVLAPAVAATGNIAQSVMILQSTKSKHRHSPLLTLGHMPWWPSVPSNSGLYVNITWDSDRLSVVLVVSDKGSSISALFQMRLVWCGAWSWMRFKLDALGIGWTLTMDGLGFELSWYRWLAWPWSWAWSGS